MEVTKVNTCLAKAQQNDKPNQAYVDKIKTTNGKVSVCVLDYFVITVVTLIVRHGLVSGKHVVKL